MPVSPKCNKKPITKIVIFYINELNRENIKILDLGIGYGDFGELIKNNSQQKTEITGVEIWEKYKNPKWSYYDKIIIGDILKFIKTQSTIFDIILLLDVLEHFDRKDGLALIKQLKAITNGLLIISTPVTKCPQGSCQGNSYETHRYIWKEKELKQLGFKILQQKWVLLIGAIRELQFWPLFTKFDIFYYKSKNPKLK